MSHTLTLNFTPNSGLTILQASPPACRYISLRGTEMIIKYWDPIDKICHYATVRELCKQPHLEDKLKGLYPHLGGWAA